jgi:phosphatidate phosphatase PAH1
MPPPPPRASSVQRQGYGTEKYEQLAQELTGYVEQLNKGEQGADLRNKVESLLDIVEGYAKGLNSIVRNGLELHEVACLEIPSETNEAKMDAYDKAFDESIDSYKEIFPEETIPGDYFEDYILNFFKAQSAQYEILKLRVQSQLDRLK